jgi:glucosamine-6-phosphate deaminase
MKNRFYNTGSKVEVFFEKQFQNPTIQKEQEKVKVLAVDNYIHLGQITALRLLEWVSLNPDGVVALPTGKTPEFFIKWM